MGEIGGKVKRSDVIFHSSSVTAAIVLAEPFVLVRGFKRAEQAEAPPAILRGSLVLQIHKPTKIKNISLEFKGTCRTEWPEGIPPLKVDTHETKTVFYHGWPFFSAGNEIESVLGSPMIHVEGEHKRGRSRTLEVKDIFQAVSTIRSGSPQIRSRSRTGSMSERNHRLFSPAEYVYNFELAFPAVLPETARCNFGFVRYHLEASVERQGTFKSKLQGIRDVPIVRTLAINSIEYSEPIVIDRTWEDILHYEIVVAGKVFPLGAKIPVCISLLPLDKAGCHRIRVFITEHCEYYCKNRKVHRVEPTRRFLLLDKQPEGGMQHSLLDENNSNTDTGAVQLNLNPEVFKQFPGRRDVLRPNISSSNIKVHHWIKVSLRLSRPHPTTPGARKTYEISIDSPITLVDPRVTKTALLPAYDETPTEENVAAENSSIAFQAHNLLSESNGATAYFSQPDVAPPSIEAEAAPPNIFPPEYSSNESIQSYQHRYREFREEHIEGDHISNIYWQEESDDEREHLPNVTHHSDDSEPEDHFERHVDDHSHSEGLDADGLTTPPGTDDDITDQRSNSTGMTSASNESEVGMPALMRTNSQIDPLADAPAPSGSRTEDPPRPFTTNDYRQQRRVDQRKSGIDRRPSLDGRRRSSTSSVRFFRQTSLVSVDIVDQLAPRYRSRGGGYAESVSEWRARNEDSDDAITVNEYELGGGDRVPLLGDDQSELDLVDFDDDVISLRSRCPSVVHP